MVDLEAIINQKNAADAKWKEDRQTQRKEITDAQDEGITQITTDPEAYARYLAMQGDNFTYSPGNIALVMQGCPRPRCSAQRIAGGTWAGALTAWN